ncbi:hypothetical protein LguiA_025592 [Lonicera macranthoides]
MEVEEWVIKLVFPNGKRLDRGKNSVGLYAFLPTEMGKILLDDKWNQGILDCVPVAFIEAFTSLMKSIENAPISSLPPMFGFLPVQKSSEAKLNAVRESIKAKLVNENIVPCKSYMEQKFFQKPSEVSRLMPAFWNILGKAREEGMNLYNISSHGSINGIIQLGGMTLLLSRESHHISWLVNWNKELRYAVAQFFLPKSTQEAIGSYSKWRPLVECLYSSVNVHDYVKILIKLLSDDRKLALAFVHFLYNSFSKDYLTTEEVDSLCNAMPLIDNYGRLMSQRNGVLVPANGSRWLKLVGSNPWRGEGYVELGEDYLHSGYYAGVLTPGKEFVNFLKNHVKVADIPFLSPPNAAIPSVSAPLTKENVFLLLDWIRNLRRYGTQIPERFLTSIK